MPSTTAATFALAQHLVLLGADTAGVAEAVYHSYRPARLWVLGAALRRVEIHSPVAWSAVLASEIVDAGAEVEDCEGLVNYVIGIEGVRAGAFLRELPDGGFRASLRSKGEVDVASVARSSPRPYTRLAGMRPPSWCDLTAGGQRMVGWSGSDTLDFVFRPFSPTL